MSKCCGRAFRADIDKLVHRRSRYINCSLLFALCSLLCACSKQDPVLPGQRLAVFDAKGIMVENKPAPVSQLELPPVAPFAEPIDYEQDSDNTVWRKKPDGGREKIFSGMATAARVEGVRQPTVAGGSVYAGLSTGEVVKINARDKSLAWVADVYKASAMTGGTGFMDIVAPIVVDSGAVYVGGMGDAFCKLNDKTGAKKWCLPLSVDVPFVITGGTVFVVSADNYLYAVDAKDGAAYWRATVRKHSAPVLSRNKDERFIISVGREKFDAEDGKLIGK